MMQIICAWCLVHICWKDGKGQTGIGHGMCQTCSDRMFAEYTAQLAQEETHR